MINPELFFHFNEEKPFLFDSQNELRVSLVIPENLPYFEGHFKGNPVLPAVALLDLSLLLVNASHSSAKKTFLTIKSAKFSEVIKPNDTLFILLKKGAETDHFSVDFTNGSEVSVAKISFSVN